MDKDNVVRMLWHIKNEQYLGPKTDNLPIGERVICALEKGLIYRSATGSFIITEKGLDLLEERVSWENL